MTPLEIHDEFVRLHRVARGAWSRKDEQGLEIPCLLASFKPGITSAAQCPAGLMPPWIAHFTIFMDDVGSEAAWWPFVERYSGLAHRWHVLDDAAWRRVLAKTMIATLEIALPYDPSNVVAPVITLWEGVLAGDEPSTAAWTAVLAAAEAAWTAVLAAAAWTAAADAAAAATWAAEAAEAAGAEAAARAAARAVLAAAEAAWAAAARAAAADKITNACLDAIEGEIVMEEGK